MKICIKCNIEKDLTCFRFYNNKHINTCKTCENARSLEWVKNNPERAKELKAKSNIKHRQKVKERYNNDPEFREHKLKLARERYRKNALSKILAGAKQRSEKFGVPFDITVEDIEVPEFCPVFGFKMEISTGRPSDTSPSLDRIIPELGYVRGNVVVISYLANRMKSNASPEQLLTFANWILSQQK